MDDVKSDVSAPVEETTTEVPQTEIETQPEVPETQVVPDKSVEVQNNLNQALKIEREKRKEFQRKLAEIEGSQKLNQYDSADMETIMAHPYVQELLIKQAKQELTDYARGMFEEYKNVPESIKKAIIKNARGFVNETTKDIETAKLDLREYIEGILEGEAEAQTPTPKTFPVAATNVAKTDVPGVRPLEIQKILNKPIDEWTNEDTAKVEEYSKSNK